MKVVYSDMNTRFMDAKTDKFLSIDAKAVIQSIWRLLVTEELEIPYNRGYGCNLKRFEQYPISDVTANDIFEYVKQKVAENEPRGVIKSADAFADVNKNTITMRLHVMIKATGETGVLPDLNVVVGKT